MTRRRRKNNPNEGWITLVLVVLAALFAFAFASSAPSGLVSAMYLVVPAVSLFVIAGVFLYQYQKIAAHRKALRLLELSAVDSLDGLAFEQYVGELLRAQGYAVRFTPINDYGVDIIAKKDGMCIAVQTKRYAKPVGVGAVQEACAGMAHHKCNASMVVTNSSFTRQARNLAKSNRCVLVDRDTIANWMAARQLQMREVRKL